jgi:hypothetical protein
MDTAAHWDIHTKLYSSKEIIVVYMLRDGMLTVCSKYEYILRRCYKYLKDTAIKIEISSVLGHRWQ